MVSAGRSTATEGRAREIAAHISPRIYRRRHQQINASRGFWPTKISIRYSHFTFQTQSIISEFHMPFCVKDDVDSIGECTSLLHPDHAWIAGSRRGSSQSEQLEVEVYQLGKDFSRSLPGSRRSSFQSAEKGTVNYSISSLELTNKQTFTRK